jgi:hypothetical protein
VSPVPPKVLRVDETPAQRAQRLRSEMHAVGEEPSPPKTEQQLSDEALTAERLKYEAMNLDDVLEREIKILLALPTTGTGALYPNHRQALIKAGVGLIMARAKIGPVWGGALADDEEETTE